MSTSRKEKAEPVPFIRITPPHKWIPLNLRELWNYRELLYSFTWRDVKIRYKQTALGFLWAIIQPLCMMLIFTIFFGRLAKIPSDGFFRDSRFISEVCTDMFAGSSRSTRSTSAGKGRGIMTTESNA